MNLPRKSQPLETMEHLSHFGSDTCHPIDFPLVYEREMTYEGDDFYTYCFHSEYCSCGISDHNLEEVVRDIPGHADMIQTWLFFGLLWEFSLTLKVEPRMEDFIAVDDSNGRKYLTTRNLTRYIWYWVAAEAHEDPRDEARGLRKTEIEKLLNYVRALTNRLVDEEVMEQECGHPVLIPISILGATLDAVRLLLFGTTPGAWDTPAALRRLVQEAGWCQGEVHALSNAQLSPPSFYLLASRPKRPDNKDHGGCSDTCCVAYQLDESIYRTAHVIPDCQCSHHVQEEIGSAVESILLRGGIPACVVDEMPDGGDAVQAARDCDQGVKRFTVHIVDTLTVSSYVAISHVWSDGMGNTTGNTLPACLWIDLQRRTQRLFPGETTFMPFWIDTICVPRERTLRTLAIRGLKQVYQAATKVLVMDKSLQSLSLDTSTPFELLFYTAISPWGRRLWTFQEACLAKELYFDFEDKPRDGFTLVDMCLDGNAPTKLDATFILEPSNMVDVPDEHTSLVWSLTRALAVDGFWWKINTSRLFEFYSLGNSHFPEPQDYRLLSWLKQWGDVDPVVLDLIRYVADMILLESGPVRRCTSVTHPLVDTRLNPELSSPKDRCAAILLGLQGRMTSRMDDEAVCTANLMGIDPLPIMNLAGPNERMKLLLSTLHRLPGHVFFNPYPRMADAGFGWAPKSFLNMGRYLNLDRRITARLGPLGLNLRCPGIQLCLGDFDQVGRSDIIVGVEGRYFVLSMKAIKDDGAMKRREMWSAYQSCFGSNLTLMLAGVPQGPLDVKPAALVHIHERDEEEHVLVVDYWEYVEVRDWGFLHGNEIDGSGTWLDKSQKWCVR